jgi:hypothetical protein
MPMPSTTALPGDRPRQALNVVFAVTQMLTPYVAQLVGFGVPIGEQSSSDTWVTPAGYAFSIWGFIFLGSLAYAVHQAAPARRADPLLRRIGWLTVAAFAACTLWTVFAQALLLWVTVPLIALMLGTLAAVLVRVADHPAPLTPRERWLVAVPMGVYAGWLTVATVANTAAALKADGVERLVLSGPAWAYVLLVVAALIAAFVVARTRNAGYAVAVAWGLAGVAVARAEEITTLAYVAAAASGVVLLAILFRSRAAPDRFA